MISNLKFSIISLILLGAIPTQAFESMRPGIELQATAEGLQIHLDYSRINPDQWSELLEEPQRFYEAGYGLAGQEGEAALPLLTELIPIEEYEHPEIASVSQQAEQRLSFQLKRTPPGRLEEEPMLSASAFDWSSEIRSKPLVSLGEPLKYMGQTYLPVTIHPLILDVDQQKVKIPGDILIQITGVQVGDPASIGEQGSLRSVIPNGQIYDQLGHYLIITPPLFEPYLQHLVNWKERKGHKVTVVTTTEAGTNPSTLKNYIQDAYDTWEVPPAYVLLIGDEDRGIGGFYVYNPDNEALVTDHPYVLLDGDDSFPEAWVGRLSVDTGGELATVISKILHYEQQPSLNEPGWFKRALMVCTVTAAVSTQHVNNWVARKLEENGFTEIDTAYYPMQSSLSFISNPINDGVGFVNCRGLGAWDHWIGPYFYNSDIDALHNGYKLPILTSIVCGGGNFASHVDPVFGEKWIRAGTSGVPKGAVAFIGPSEVHTHTQFNNVINVGLYSAMFDLGMNELGPALWHGKLDLWRNYHQSDYLPFGQSAEFYHNVYNILGDPGMNVWTDTPQTLTVDFPSSLNMNADHIMIQVADELGNAVSDAFVYILNGDNAQGRKTDATGTVVLPVYSGVDTTLALTITGKNLNPVLETIALTGTQLPLSYVSWEIASAELLEAGSTRGFDLSLVNHSGMIDSLTMQLAASGAGATLLDSIYTLTNLPAGSSVDLQNIFALEVDASVRHGEHMDLLLTVDIGSETLTWRRSFPVQAPELSIQNLVINSGELTAGGTVNVQLNMRNSGGVASSPLTLTYLGHPFVAVEEPLVGCPMIGVNETQLSEGALELELSEQLFPGERLDLAFAINQASHPETLSYSLEVGAVNRFSPSLPDAYGYRIFDDMDVSYSQAPVYEWIEIDPDLGGSGTSLNISDNYEEDDATIMVALPFPVSYYGQNYESMTVCSNGWLALGSSPEVSFYNRVIPSAEGPNAMIAPFWDDLITDQGGVSYHYSDGQIIVEWSRVSHLSVHSTLNFQVIIYDTESYPTETGDNLIKMQFKDHYDFDTWMNFSTTGIEAPDYITGLQAGYNNRAEASVGDLHSGQALLFSTNRGTRLPAPEMSLSSTVLSFNLNPWSQSSDSIAISNTGGSALVYTLGRLGDVGSQPGSNPLADYPFVKGGPEPSGESYTTSDREVFDYEWQDQDDAGGPSFEWQDIAVPANELSYGFDPDDSFIGPLDIGFAFPFYSETYSEFFFSSNGTMSFTSSEYPWANLTLPNGSAPPALIAPWWDDLNNNSGIQGVPYFWTNGVDTAVVTWDNFPKFGTDERHTFQVILCGNGDILFQYLEMEGVSSSATIGIQNATRNYGVLVLYNTTNNIDSGHVIRIRRSMSWLTVNNWGGRIEVGETGYFAVNVDTRNLEAGNYNLPLVLSSNAPEHLQTPINLNLDVVYGIPPQGDVNIDYQLNIVDLTFLIDLALQLETGTAEQVHQGDLSGDDQLDVLDTILLIELLLDY